MRQKRVKRYEQAKKAAKRKRIATTYITVAIIAILYLSPTLYFIEHFNYGTSINNIDVSFKKVQQVNGILAEELQQYQLKINGDNNQSDTLSASQMGLAYEAGNSNREFKEKQQTLLWFMPFINNENEKYAKSVQCDEELLKKSIEELALLSTAKSALPTNASIKYINGQYEILPESQGVTIDTEEIYKDIFMAICSQQKEIDIEIKEYRVEPQYTQSSNELLVLKQTLNKYINAKISYPTEDGEIIIDKALIHTWLTIQDDLTVIIDKAEIIDYLTNLKEQGIIKQTTIEFMTSAGNLINLKKGKFSSEVDIEQETTRLIEDIKAGNSVTRQPAVTGIGKTYVEIDLTNQHLWLIKDGNCFIDGDIVTGNVRAGHTTPPGLFKIKGKAKNVVLRGPDYASPVTYWMPFNGGIGIHDANWRSKFGGSIYKTSGSHGCINCPYNLAKTIYNNIETGTPVVCYN